MKASPKLLNELLKDLENNIDSYIGDYGTLEYRVEDTYRRILNILKLMNGKDIKEIYSEYFLEKLEEE